MNSYQPVGAFGKGYNETAGLFREIANHLRSPDEDMGVSQSKLESLKQAKLNTSNAYQQCRNGLASVQGGLTGAKKGMWTSGTVSLATLIGLGVAAVQQLAETYKKSKNGEDVQWAPVAVQTIATGLYIASWGSWWLHSKNARTEAEYVEANSTENQSILEMEEFVDAANDLARGIKNTPDQDATQWPEIQRICKVYRQLPMAQQIELGELPAMKELYLIEIRKRLSETHGQKLGGIHSVDYGNNTMIKIYDRLRILGMAYKQGVSQVHHAQESQSDILQKLPFTELKEKGSKVIDKARGEWDNLKGQINLTYDNQSNAHDPKQLLIGNVALVRLWMATEWLRLEGYIKELPKVTLSDGSMMGKYELFDPNVPKIKQQANQLRNSRDGFFGNPVEYV